MDAKQDLKRQQALGEAFAAYIIGGAAYQYGLRLNGAIQRNPDHPDTETLRAAFRGMVAASHRANRWLRRAVKTMEGEAVDDATWTRLALILQDLNRRYMGLTNN